MMLAVTHIGWLPQVFGQSWLQYAFPIVWSYFLAFSLIIGITAVGRTNLKVHAWGRDRAEAAAQAAADVERVRLVALQAQMNPQFLFNTLSTVAALAVPEPARAERVVEHLSAVLRHSLQRADQPATTVDDEMRFVREYLAVEQERLGWRLRVTWAIDDYTRDLRVPAMSVGTLVEEAIARGVESRQAGGDLRISAIHTATGDLLRLSVDVDGPGAVEAEGKASRLVTLRQRLRAEYDDTFALDQETLTTALRLSISIPAVRMGADAVSMQQAEL
jgi:LytS/YehU family sensor histidine kinase